MTTSWSAFDAATRGGGSLVVVVVVVVIRRGHLFNRGEREAERGPARRVVVLL